MKEYTTLKEIVEQLEFCNYRTTDGLHDLNNNAAFISLKKLAEDKSSSVDGVVSLQKAGTIEGIKKALEIISEVYKEIPLAYSYDEDARYNYPERENEVYKRLNSLLSA